jgi:hypothetical protein
MEAQNDINHMVSIYFGNSLEFRSDDYINLCNCIS